MASKTWERNIEGIKKNARRKSVDTLERAEAALKQLVREGKPITFSAVAEAGNVSEAWLYRQRSHDPKNPGLTERIEELRDQQKRQNKPKKDQQSRNHVPNAVVQTLQFKVQNQDKEIKELKQQVKAWAGIVRQYYALEKEVETLRETNRQLIEENNRLAALSRGINSSVPAPLKVVSLNVQKDLPDEVLQGFVEIGITPPFPEEMINAAILSINSDRSNEPVLAAIQVVAEAQQNNAKDNPVRDPIRYFISALQRRAIPNSKRVQPLPLSLKPEPPMSESKKLKLWRELAINKHKILQTTLSIGNKLIGVGCAELDNAQFSIEDWMILYPLELLEEAEPGEIGLRLPTKGNQKESEKNKRLREENQELKGRLMGIESLEAENRDLQKQLSHLMNRLKMMTAVEDAKEAELFAQALRESQQPEISDNSKF